jgi:hypothetical protein
VSDPFVELRAATSQLQASAALLSARIVTRLRARRAACAPSPMDMPPLAQAAELPLLAWVRTGVTRVLSVLARRWRGPPRSPSREDLA